MLEDFQRYFQQARAEDFDAINLYELAVFTVLGKDGKLVFDYPGLWELTAQCNSDSAAV